MPVFTHHPCQEGGGGLLILYLPDIHLYYMSTMHTWLCPQLEKYLMVKGARDG